MRWTRDRLDWLIKSKEMYNDREDILNAFNKHFSLDVTLSLLTKNNGRYKLGLPKAYRILRKNAEITQIKRRGFFKREDGYVSEFMNGCRTFIKADGGNRKDGFVPKNRYLYEQYHNVKLDTVDDVIIFLDGDYNNFNKENLYRMKRNAHILMINHGLYANKNADKLSLIKFCEWKQKLNELKY